MPYKKGLFIFRRDLRLQDNTALNKALAACEKIIPCFIIDPRQVGEKNIYRSDNALQFMIESLNDLQEQLKKHKAKLYLLHGQAEDAVKKILEQEKIDAVFCNRDYTPFSLKRDEALEKICVHYNADFIQADDLMLNPPESIMSISGGTPYTVFTAYWKNAERHAVTEPVKLISTNFYTGKLALETPEILTKIAPKLNSSIAVHGGTSSALKILKSIENFEHYKDEHDYPAIATTKLSAHNKFGTVSIRTVFHTIGKTLGYGHPLLRQLYWRDFFMQVAYFSPYVYGQPFREKFAAIAWRNNKKQFEAWCTGTTGFPIVDAGMRELNATGFMHNRARLIVGSFLTKDLLIDWRWAEHYFATKLVDYDPAVNNGNWQWVASTGCDAQPYFRIFNPWLQQKKFDPDCTYIKRWIPELKNVAPAIIHTWYKENSPQLKNYPRPIINHDEESAQAKKIYKDAAQHE